MTCLESTTFGPTNRTVSRLGFGGAPAGLINYTECLTAIARTLSLVFPKCWSYTTYVPSFITPWGFVLGHTDAQATLPEAEEVDRLISQRLSRPLRHLDGLTHRGLFCLPRYLREGIASEQRTVTDAQPVFMV